MCCQNQKTSKSCNIEQKCDSKLCCQRIMPNEHNLSIDVFQRKCHLKVNNLWSENKYNNNYLHQQAVLPENHAKRTQFIN